ncbi:8935_t:CDS:1, partial [Diversispora eburnea]
SETIETMDEVKKEESYEIFNEIIKIQNIPNSSVISNEDIYKFFIKKGILSTEEDPKILIKHFVGKYRRKKLDSYHLKYEEFHNMSNAFPAIKDYIMEMRNDKTKINQSLNN